MGTKGTHHLVLSTYMNITKDRMGVVTGKLLLCSNKYTVMLLEACMSQCFMNFSFEWHFLIRGLNEQTQQRKKYIHISQHQ